MAAPRFDIDRVVNVLSALSTTTGLGATLFTPSSEDGTRTFFSTESCSALCPHFDMKKGWNEECNMAHRLASVFADNSGKCYMYICPEDHLFFAAPLVQNNCLVATATIGPVDILDSEDEGKTASEWRSKSDKVPNKPGEYLHHLPSIVTVLAQGLNATGYSRTRIRQTVISNDPLGPDMPLSGIKTFQTKDYPAISETNLMEAINKADVSSARAALEDILGYLLSSSLVDSRYKLFERVSELVSAIAHAALRRGVSAEAVFPVSEQCHFELRAITSADQMCSRVHHFMEQIIELTRDLFEVEFDDFKYRSLLFVHENFREQITLDDAAEALGFSPAYFSRTFKKRTGKTFINYVNMVRVQAAKNELLSTDADIASIAKSVGFNSTSYFIRVFKGEVGLSPNTYRSRRGA